MGLIPKEIKRLISTTETKRVTYDPTKEKDVKWAKKENKSLTKLEFELVEFTPGAMIYEKLYYEEYK